MTTTDRTKLRQHPERSAPDAAHAILSAGIVAHVGISDPEGPLVIPMTYEFTMSRPDRIYLHGAHHSRLLKAVATGEPVCVTVTLTDGIVLSKTALNHSVNYRSVVCFCRASGEELTLEEQRELLQGMISRYVPGRTAGVDYGVTPDRHLETTAFVPMAITALSAKMRTGGSKGPGDDDPSVLGTAGVIPVPQGRS